MLNRYRVRAGAVCAALKALLQAHLPPPPAACRVALLRLARAYSPPAPTRSSIAATVHRVAAARAAAALRAAARA
eukprot:6276921-Prymnesium_polylepis.1